MHQVGMGHVRPYQDALGVLGDERQDRPYRPPPDDVVDGQLRECSMALDGARQGGVLPHRERPMKLDSEPGHLFEIVPLTSCFGVASAARLRAHAG